MGLDSKQSVSGEAGSPSWNEFSSAAKGGVSKAEAKHGSP